MFDRNSGERPILMTYNPQFIILYSIEGCVRRHISVNTNSPDYTYLETIAIEKGKMGMNVDILPTLSISDPLRAIFFADAIGSKCPDLRINGVLWEVKQPANPWLLNNMKHNIAKGANQANHIIINLTEKVDYQYLNRIVKGRFKDHKNLEELEFRYQGEYISFIWDKKDAAPKSCVAQCPVGPCNTNIRII